MSPTCQLTYYTSTEGSYLQWRPRIEGNHLTQHQYVNRCTAAVNLIDGFPDNRAPIHCLCTSTAGRGINTEVDQVRDELKTLVRNATNSRRATLWQPGSSGRWHIVCSLADPRRSSPDGGNPPAFSTPKDTSSLSSSSPGLPPSPPLTGTRSSEPTAMTGERSLYAFQVHSDPVLRGCAGGRLPLVVDGAHRMPSIPFPPARSSMLVVLVRVLDSQLFDGV